MPNVLSSEKVMSAVPGTPLANRPVVCLMPFLLLNFVANFFFAAKFTTKLATKLARGAGLRPERPVF